MKLNQRTLDSLLQIDIINDMVIQSVCLATICQKSAKFIVNKLNSEIATIDIRKNKVKIILRIKTLVFLIV